MNDTREWVKAVHVNRSAYADSFARRMEFVLGHCEKCDRPVRGENATSNRVVCPDCKTIINGLRLYAVNTELNCDGSCMSARRDYCECGCGGVNHGANWAYPISESEMTQKALDKFREHQQKIEIARKNRDNAKKAKIENEYIEWENANAEFVTALLTFEGENYFIADLAQQVKSRKPLTENQVNAGQRAIDRENTRQKEIENRKANAKPVPTGNVTIRGKIVKADLKESFFNGHETVTWKMTVACDGFAVYSTIPRNLMDIVTEIWRKEGCESVIPILKGREVEFTAAIEKSRDNESFGFAKRPKNARFI